MDVHKPRSFTATSLTGVGLWKHSAWRGFILIQFGKSIWQNNSEEENDGSLFNWSMPHTARSKKIDQMANSGNSPRLLFAFWSRANFLSLSSRFLPLIEPIRETHKQDGKRAIEDRRAFRTNVRVTMNARLPAVQAGRHSLWPCAWPTMCAKSRKQFERLTCCALTGTSWQILWALAMKFAECLPSSSFWGMSGILLSWELRSDYKSDFQSKRFDWCERISQIRKCVFRCAALLVNTAIYQEDLFLRDFEILSTRQTGLRSEIRLFSNLFTLKISLRI